MNTYRKQEAYAVRQAAADMAKDRVHPQHRANDDEQKFRSHKNHKPNYLMSYTKGLPHDFKSGLVLNPEDFQQFVKAIDSGDPWDFVNTPLGPVNYPGDESNATAAWKSSKAKSVARTNSAGKPIKGAKIRAWESQGAGKTYDLEGPDAQAVTMPPAPALGSDELTAEMGEVYAQALLRDVPFTEIVKGTGVTCCTKKGGKLTAKKIIEHLNKLNWFSNDNCCELSDEEAARKRGQLNGQTAFRGITPGDDIGPYISQFLLSGNQGINGNDSGRPRSQGLITYGAITIDQRVRYAKPCDDHMIKWEEWYDVQQGADLRGMEAYRTKKYDTKYCNRNKDYHRFITTPRDLATYVHYDALYEAYLNACLILLAEGIPFDPDIPFQISDYEDHQQGFAHFGGPHILSLVTEVATRALKAVRYQKFNIHRRCRPEVLAARLHITKHADLKTKELVKMRSDLKDILKLVNNRNGAATGGESHNHLLPMAFCEGSPMHPAYGAGHATVAGACVTILKAFFDHKHPLALAQTGNAGKAFVPDTSGNFLKVINTVNAKGKPCELTVEGELNKLCSNIAIGRDWAGVHYFTDYIESIRMGEHIAIGILQEQKLTYGENFSMTIPLFDGGSVRV